jgi:hypothetical protein
VQIRFMAAETGIATLLQARGNINWPRSQAELPGKS